ncbi:MAG: hypothetical protein M1828_007033 [Chrysothrix sp. TS-e1954]|nr:MAG: hypothetical protein M1828_007033 [Chrysothrix sp. TS-e1954]
MSRGGGTTLYVTGFGHGTRARDLAFEFERFAFVEYESRRDSDDAYHEMHNKRVGRDDMLKIEWARTPPSASWRFDPGSSRDRPPRRERSPPRRRSRTPPPRSRDFSPRRDDRRDRDYDRRDRDRGGDRDRDRGRDRSRSPDDSRRDLDMKDRDRGRSDDRSPAPENGDEERRKDSPRPAEDELDVAE